VKVAITRGGGLAGLSQTSELASDQLSEGDAEQLKSLAKELPEQAGDSAAQSKPHPDEQTVELAITDEDGSSRIYRYLETELPDQARALINWAEAQPAAQKRLVPPA
jgi:Emfourin